MAVKSNTDTRPRRKAPSIEEPAVRYFLRRLERAEDQYLVDRFLHEYQTHHEVPFELVDHFVRRIRQQNIFVYMQGPNGKQESLLLTKVLFSMNKVVRLYVSLSMREEDYRFLRIYPNPRTGKITVEQLRDRQAAPQEVFSHRDQCHIIRYLTNWIVAHLDWKKTKLRNLDIYKLFVETRQRQLEQKLRDLNDAKAMGQWMIGGNSQVSAAQASR